MSALKNAIGYATANGGFLEMANSAPKSDAIEDYAKREDLTNIITTGSTNTTGSSIPAKTYFYLNGALCKAIADIATGATYTLNTNFTVVSVGEELTRLNNTSTQQYTLNNEYVTGTITTVITNNICHVNFLLQCVKAPSSDYGTEVYLPVPVNKSANTHFWAFSWATPTSTPLGIYIKSSNGRVYIKHGTAGAQNYICNVDYIITL